MVLDYNDNLQSFHYKYRKCRFLRDVICVFVLGWVWFLGWWTRNNRAGDPSLKRAGRIKGVRWSWILKRHKEDFKKIEYHQRFISNYYFLYNQDTSLLSSTPYISMACLLSSKLSNFIGFSGPRPVLFKSYVVCHWLRSMLRSALADLSDSLSARSCRFGQTTLRGVG